MTPSSVGQYGIRFRYPFYKWDANSIARFERLAASPNEIHGGYYPMDDRGMPKLK
jgi:hypothetical protein